MLSLKQIEARIDAIEAINPDDPRIPELEKLADELAEELNKVEDAIKASLARREIEQRELALKERINSKHGNYLEWMEWAESLYPITENEGTFTVTSNATNWKEEMNWSYNTKIECLEQIERLVNYKINDRNRGRGDMSKDLKGA